ncbi:MAG: hypothetical protein IPH57_06480 [Saprospiraceae bacterium]|nr:hypothetical protein [Saprospiraceae bacterium]
MVNIPEFKAKLFLKNLKNIFFILQLLLFFMLTGILRSQNIPFPDTIKVDSTEAEIKGLFDKENRKTFKIIFSGKPAKAALFSLVIPGGGQAYNRKYWKVPIAWGLVGFFGYHAIQSRNTYKEMDNAYRCMLRGENCSYENITDAITLRPYRDQARNTNERNWVTFSAVYLIQVLEAYIDRHLIDFDLNENLAFKSTISPDFAAIGLTMLFNKKSSAQKKLYDF